MYAHTCLILYLEPVGPKWVHEKKGANVGQRTFSVEENRPRPHCEQAELLTPPPIHPSKAHCTPSLFEERGVDEPVGDAG